ncbi:MAG TPA: CapA family protein, partial [Candidatus Limnocylindrales bacterium]|nr:CapA family protein [Candidatus Limnocylindrales bacterium]
YCQGCLVFVGDERYAAAVADAGFHVLSLAGNHSGDAGPDGVLDSMRALDSVDIQHFGAGPDAAAAARPLVIQRGEVRIAFLGYGDVPPVDYGATETRPGHNRLEHDDAAYARVREAVAAARRLADVVIVMPHWGIEYEARPRPWIVEAARAMVEAGADVIIGDHPHWVQPIEVDRGAFIAYSVGNFVFDQMWSEETRRGTILRLSFRGPRLVAARAVPTIIEDYYRPRPLAPEEPAYRAVLDRLWRTSVTAP